MIVYVAPFQVYMYPFYDNHDDSVNILLIKNNKINRLILFFCIQKFHGLRIKLMLCICINFYKQTYGILVEYCFHKTKCTHIYIIILGQ